MRRWVITVFIASVAVVIALVALWFAVVPQIKGGGKTGSAAAQTTAPDAGKAPQAPANGGTAGPGQPAKPQCAGRYADSLEQISPTGTCVALPAESRVYCKAASDYP